MGQSEVRRTFIMKDVHTALDAVQEVWHIQDQKLKPRTLFSVDTLHDPKVSAADKFGDELLQAILTRDRVEYEVKYEVQK